MLDRFKGLSAATLKKRSADVPAATMALEDRGIVVDVQTDPYMSPVDGRPPF